MKKSISVLLSVLFTLGLLPLSVFADRGDELSFVVVSDIHQFYAERYVNSGSKDADYPHASTNCKMYVESVAIFDKFLEQVEASDYQTVIISGDITDYGNEEDSLATAQRLREFEERTGKRFFVINGNHDMAQSSPDDFKSYYADFGYDCAVAVDPDSCSYTADLNNEYRLLAIDTCIPMEASSYSGFNESRLAWVKAQLEQAKLDGKKVISITHHNLLEHFILAEKIYARGRVPTSFGLAELLADSGVELNFCGHTHDHDIAVYESKAGNKLYEALTECLITYPCLYRTVDFTSEGVKLDVAKIESIDTSKLPEGLTSVAAEDIKTDFPKYAEKYYYAGMSLRLYNTINGETLNKALKIQKDDPLYGKINTFASRLRTALSMPLYSTDGEDCIENMVAKYNTTLPKSDYKTGFDIAAKIYEVHMIGDEDLPSYSDELVIAYRAGAACIDYAAAELEQEDYEMLITALVDLVGIEKYFPEKLTSILAGSITRYDGLELVLTYSLATVADKFTIDKAPSDSVVTLAIYGTAEPTQVNAFATLLAKIRTVIVKYFRLIFVFLGK